MTNDSQAHRGSFRANWSGLSVSSDQRFLELREDCTPWLTPTTLDEFVRFLEEPSTESHSAGRLEPVTQARAAHIAVEFHLRAGTLTDAVRRQINAYRAELPTIRVAHQPNFLPAWNIVAQTALCDAVARSFSKNACQVFVLVDYDVNTDRRYRHALFPSISAHNGFRSLSAPPLHHSDEALMFADTKPAASFAMDTVKIVNAIARQDLGVIRHGFNDHSINRYMLGCGEETFARHFNEAFQRGRNLADANAIFLSRIVNIVLGLPTTFLPGHKLLSLLVPQLEYFWAESGNLAHATMKAADQLKKARLTVSRSLVGDSHTAPFWLLCAKCDSRLPLRWAKVGQTAVPDVCRLCGNCSGQVRLEDLPDLLQNPDRPTLIPRVMLDDLLDGVAWQHIAGCSYRGGLEHHAFSALVARNMKLRPLPEFFSQRRQAESLAGLVPSSYLDALEVGDDCKQARELLATGRASIAHTLLWKGELSAKQSAAEFLAQ